MDNTQEMPIRNAGLQRATAQILRYGTHEYDAAYARLEGEQSPSVTSINAKEQEITLVGTQHERDPKSPEITALIDTFRKYVAQTADRPTKQLLMVEGGGINGPQTIEDKTRVFGETVKILFAKHNITTVEEATRQFGEMGTVMFLAREANIAIMSPEPSNEETIAHLKTRGFTDEELVTFYSMRAIDALTHRGELASQQKFTQKEIFDTLTSVCEQVGYRMDLVFKARLAITAAPHQAMQQFLDDVVPQLNIQLHQAAGVNLVNEDLSWGFDARDVQGETYQRLNSPISEESFLNRISRQSAEFRDDYILARINEAVQQNQSPMVVFGSGHTVALTPALEALYPSA